MASTTVASGQTPFDAIADVLAAKARQVLAKAYQEDRERPVGEVRLDIAFYSKEDAKKPVEDYDFTDVSGRRFQGFGARWCVAKYKWTGSRWHRFRKLTGPLKFEEALTRCTEECARLSLKRVGR